MISSNASEAWDQVVCLLGIVVVVSLLVIVAWAQVDRARERAAIRARLAGLPKPAPVSLEGFREQLVAAANADRGDNRVG